MVHNPGLQGRKGVQGDRVHGPWVQDCEVVHGPAAQGSKVVCVMVHCKVFTKVDYVQVERTCHVMVSKVVHGPCAHGPGEEGRNVRYEKFPVSVYRKNYTDIIGIPVFLRY